MGTSETSSCPVVGKVPRQALPFHPGAPVIGVLTVDFCLWQLRLIPSSSRVVPINPLKIATVCRDIRGPKDQLLHEKNHRGSSCFRSTRRSDEETAWPHLPCGQKLNFPKGISTRLSKLECIQRGCLQKARHPTFVIFR